MKVLISLAVAFILLIVIDIVINGSGELGNMLSIFAFMVIGVTVAAGTIFGSYHLLRKII